MRDSRLGMGGLKEPISHLNFHYNMQKKITLKQFYPKISIVTPCYNSGKYLEETIISILQQGYPNLEYIIIDGGSTDNSIDIINKYQNQLTYWISEKDNGMYDAIQKGFLNSTGEIMAWINADDLYHKQSFSIIAEIFSSFSCINWLVGASTQWDEHGRCINISQSRKFTRYDFLIGDFKWLQQESCFWRRSLWEKAGAYVDTALLYAGDLDLWIRFSRFEQLYVANVPIGGFRIRSSNQLSLDHMQDYLEEAKEILKKENLNKTEKKILKKYNNFRKFMKFISKLKIFNTNGIINTYRKLKFRSTEDIHFNRYTQKFEIHEP
jgi:glycosyltransferase involved in cell wall biosynthesis